MTCVWWDVKSYSFNQIWPRRWSLHCDRVRNLELAIANNIDDDTNRPLPTTCLSHSPALCASAQHDSRPNVAPWKVNPPLRCLLLRNIHSRLNGWPMTIILIRAGTFPASSLYCKNETEYNAPLSVSCTIIDRGRQRRGVVTRRAWLLWLTDTESQVTAYSPIITLTVWPEIQTRQCRLA